MNAKDLGVSRETFAKLTDFERLLKKWSAKINLVSKSSIHDFWTRHVVDSLQLSQFAAGGTWLDLGSGGGFPGLVLGIASPGTPMILVESDQRKCAFLRHVAQELDLKVRVLSQRIEGCPPQDASVVSARALAPLGKLLGYGQRHVADDGICVFPKGKMWQEELREAQQQWSFDWEVVNSKTQEDSAILIIRKIKRV
ncbi:MAG: 16S rRNA (guanine(527)-N(7))-methyltransferase RsmG [Sedimentitalea sp.]